MNDCGDHFRSSYIFREKTNPDAVWDYAMLVVYYSHNTCRFAQYVRAFVYVEIAIMLTKYKVFN